MRVWLTRCRCVAGARGEFLLDGRAPVCGVGLLGFFTAFGRGRRLGCVAGSGYECEGRFWLGVTPIKFLLNEVEVLVAAVGEGCCVGGGNVGKS